MVANATRLKPADCKDPVICFAAGLGTGLVPKMPGTVGSVAALPFWWFLFAELHWLVYLGCLVALFFAGLAAADRAGRVAGQHDDQAIVFDEFVGVWVTLFLVPKAWWALPAGLLLFRLFDITKPWPVSWADRRLAGAWGVMLDDVLAGVYAAVVLQLSIAAAHWGGLLSQSL